MPETPSTSAARQAPHGSTWCVEHNTLDGCSASAARPPQVVEDQTGNLWRWYGDAGYILLITISKSHTPAEPTLDALVAKVGNVREWVPA